MDNFHLRKRKEAVKQNISGGAQLNDAETHLCLPKQVNVLMETIFT